MSRFSDALDGLGGAQKSNYGVPAYSRFINRKLGRLFAAVGYQLGLSPSQVTVISATCSGAGIALLAFADASVSVGVAVALLLVLGYALDAADGQLARFTRAGSMSGEWLDHTLDAAKISLLHLAVLVGWYRGGELSEGWYIVPIAFEAIAVVRFSAMVLVDQLRRSVGHVVGADNSGASLARSFGVLFIDYGLLCLVFVTWGATDVFAWLYGALCVTNGAYLLLVSAKHYRELRALAAATSKVAAA